MKVFRSLLVVLAIGAASLSSAQARDSVSFSINLGGPGYYAYPAVTHYVAPQAVYYPTQRIYYSAPYAYYPAAGYGGGYYYSGPRHYGGHHQHRGHGHHGHHGHYGQHR